MSSIIHMEHNMEAAKDPNDDSMEIRPTDSFMEDP
jgi:hypothetical protein